MKTTGNRLQNTSFKKCEKVLPETAVSFYLGPSLVGTDRIRLLTRRFKLSARYRLRFGLGAPCLPMDTSVGLGGTSPEYL